VYIIAATIRQGILKGTDAGVLNIKRNVDKNVPDLADFFVASRAMATSLVLYLVINKALVYGLTTYFLMK